MSTHEQRMAIMQEVVDWLRAAPTAQTMEHSTNGVGLARRARQMTVREAADELQRQVDAGTA